jgi:hypothetical protein
MRPFPGSKMEGGSKVDILNGKKPIFSAVQILNS